MTQTKTITDISGIYGSAMCCGIRKDEKDLAFIYVPQCHSVAGVFTKNHFKAACISHTQECFNKGLIKAVVINSGNANAVTGELGQKNVQETAEIAADLLGLRPNNIAIASTGIIGVQLPMNNIRNGLYTLLKNPSTKEGHSIAEAILTTDTFQKESFRQKTIGGETITVAGMAKGSGMVAPNMATMLGFLATDARLPKNKLQRHLLTAVEDTFNMTTVDGDTSTNDAVLLFSSGNKSIKEHPSTEALFQELLTDVCIDLARLIATDGEGAQKLIEIRVLGAMKKHDARVIARNIANSPLVKTAVHGADPNWGRILMAAGKEPSVSISPEKVSLYLGNEQILNHGQISHYDRSIAVNILSESNVIITIDLNLGGENAVAWGCDLTKKYIDINTDYN